MDLVIVESPTKAKTINKFLGRKYIVKSSMGHLIDLPKSQLGVDPDQDFDVKYITIRGKGKALAELRKFARKADNIYLATDPDREGEAIAWHLARDFKLDGQQCNRVVFNEITKDAVKNAFSSPRKLNYDLIDAQQARRVLDRLVGYKISPLLWEKVKKGLSAGRVQSATLNMICQRDEEIDSFVPQEYWSIEVDFNSPSGPFRAKLAQVAGAKPQLSNKEDADEIVQQVKDNSFALSKLDVKERKKRPRPPFTTSTMQQQAGRDLNYSARKAMVIAQQLYEGISLGKRGSTGLITYMRTDSVSISTAAQQQTQEFVQQQYGSEFVPAQPPMYSARKDAQQAHEAIRPTDVFLTPEHVQDYLSPEQLALYRLIWQRFVMSQMKPALYTQQSATISGGQLVFRASHMKLIFPGFLKLAPKAEEKRDQGIDLEKTELGHQLGVEEIHPQQHFTQPPARYSEALLIRDMEQKGIGRPSTYAPTIETLLQRVYIEKLDGKLHSTELGVTVNKLLGQFFPDILNLDFTAELESQLDTIAEGQLPWKRVVSDFYSKFRQDVEVAQKEMDKVEVEDEETDEICEHCGRNMVIKRGRFGKFLACPGYPDCKNTKPLLNKIDVSCPKCDGEIVQLRSRKGRLFYGCSNYPDCDFRSWKRPVAENCPQCKELLVVAKKNTLACSNPDCDYTREREASE